MGNIPGKMLRDVEKIKKKLGFEVMGDAKKKDIIGNGRNVRWVVERCQGCEKN
jgi:hypothetical protein